MRDAAGHDEASSALSSSIDLILRLRSCLASLEVYLCSRVLSLACGRLMHGSRPRYPVMGQCIWILRDGIYIGRKGPEKRARGVTYDEGSARRSRYMQHKLDVCNATRRRWAKAPAAKGFPACGKRRPARQRRSAAMGGWGRRATRPPERVWCRLLLTACVLPRAQCACTQGRRLAAWPLRGGRGERLRREPEEKGACEP